MVTGLVHGFWTNRWAWADETAVPAARLGQVATDLGEWHGEPLEQAPRQMEPISGYLYRRYTNQRTGVVVVVALICGQPGPVSIHTPDVCYGASGYEVAPHAKYTLPASGDTPAADFWTSQLRKTQAASQTNLRIFWSWTSSGNWQIADNPRLAFAHLPVLFKLYVIRDLSSSSEPLEDDPSLDLLRQLLPELQHKVFSP